MPHTTIPRSLSGPTADGAISPLENSAKEPKLDKFHTMKSVSQVDDAGEKDSQEVVPAGENDQEEQMWSDLLFSIAQDDF